MSRNFTYACISGGFTLTICTFLAVRGNRPEGLLLLPLVYVLVFALLAIERKSNSSQGAGVVLIALLGIAIAYCAGVASGGGMHHSL